MAELLPSPSTMKASLAWLNSYLDRPVSRDEAQERLSAVGFPVEHTEDVTVRGGLPDVMLDVEITSNRGDCLSHVGLAREVAAATGRSLKLPDPKLPAASGDVKSLASVRLDEPELCPVYTARVITGVRVGPSPQWLVDRLEAVGLRSVNNVVDVTNFVLLEMGQPLHAFDLAKLRGRQIVVRRAKDKEPFTAIDRTKHALTRDMLVIADAEAPVAIAGVMGGLDSEVGDATTDVLLESAIFAPLSVRRTSRALRLSSDSSYRFERGIDPLGVERASRRAAALIVELAGGTLAEGVIRVGQPEPSPREVSMRPGRCDALLGVSIEPAKQVEYLRRLGLEPRLNDGRITCTIPTYRRDLEREVDLIEEVARSHGLDNVPVDDRIGFVVRPRQPRVAARQATARVLVAHGYHEAVTFSFLPEKQGEGFVPQGAGPVVIPDERRKTEPLLRPSLLPSLLACRKLNQDAGNADVRLYETASTWAKRGERIEERVNLALLRDATDRDAAAREVRGTIEEVVGTLGGPAARERLAFEPGEDSRFTAAAALVRLGDRVVGAMGVLGDDTLRRFDVKTPQVGAELDLASLLDLYPPQRTVKPLPRFPAIERDLSIIVEEAVAWRDVEAAVRGAKPAMLEDVRFLGTYRGKPIEKGRKSVSLRMLFRDPNTTLRHEQVDPQVAAVVKALADAVGAVLRG